MQCCREIRGKDADASKDSSMGTVLRNRTAKISPVAWKFSGTAEDTETETIGGDDDMIAEVSKMIEPEWVRKNGIGAR